MKNFSDGVSEILAIESAAIAIIFKYGEKQELEILVHQAKKADIALNKKCRLDDALALKELVNAANKYPGISINIEDKTMSKYLIEFIHDELEKSNVVA